MGDSFQTSAPFSSGAEGENSARSSSSTSAMERPWEQKSLPPRRTWALVLPGIAVLLVLATSSVYYLGMKGTIPLPASLLPESVLEEIPAPAETLPVCGDGVLAESEQCDDGSTTDGDGCSISCTLEAGWVCSNLPCKKMEVCGDMVITGTESCDDGNAEAGDGCSPTCAREALLSTSLEVAQPAEDPVASPESDSGEPSS